MLPVCVPALGMLTPLLPELCVGACGKAGWRLAEAPIVKHEPVTKQQQKSALRGYIRGCNNYARRLPVINLSDQQRTFFSSAARNVELVNQPLDGVVGNSNPMAITELLDVVRRCKAEDNCDSALLHNVVISVVPQMEALPVDTLAEIATTFANLKFFNTFFKGALTDQILVRVAEFTPRQLADISWAYGEMQYYDMELMKTVISHVAKNMEKFSAAELAKILWAFARVGYQDKTLSDMMQMITTKLQQDFNAEAMSEVLFAEAQLGWMDPRLHGMVADYAMRNVHTFTPDALAKVVYALACSGYEDEELYNVTSERALEVLEHMSNIDMSRMLWALGELGHYHKGLLDAAADRFLPAHLGSLSIGDLRTIVTAFNKLGYSHPQVAQAAHHLMNVIEPWEKDPVYAPGKDSCPTVSLSAATTSTTTTTTATFNRTVRNNGVRPMA